MSWKVILFLLLLGVGIWIYRNKSTLLATVEIISTGEKLNFQIETADNRNLMILLIAYFAKVRWLLETEPASGLQRIKEMYDDVLSSFPNINDYTIFSSAAFGESLIFKVKAIKKGNGIVGVMNDIPEGAGTMDIVDSCFVLLKEISNRLSSQEKEVLLPVLKKFRPLIFVEKMDESLTGLMDAYKATSSIASLIKFEN